MTATNEDFLFAQEAQNLGYVTEEQVEEGFLLQRRMADDLKIDERLAVILVKRGWMADEQARRVYGIIEPEGARSRIEGYRLVQKIGRGAMGTVYKAIHKGLHRVVAIKILRRDLATDKTQIERLKREAQLLADLDHPNIVRAFDAGESNGFPYLVMEYVEGDTLREYVTEKGRLSNEEALRITRSLADALEKARRMGIVHRDVKPGNILMNKSGTPKLMDLGLAKGPLDPGLTQHGATVGTPQFMSPEQAESPDKADTKSDIYSLGATLYAMVTGHPPFEGSTLAEVITKVMSQQPVPPRVRNPDVSPEVSHLIERMMLKDASLRYDTPSEVIADIDRIRGGQSIIPRGFQGNWEGYLLRKKFLQWRRRIVVGLAAALVIGVGAFWIVRERVREDKRGEIASYAKAALELPEVDETHSVGNLRSFLAKSQNYAERIRDIELDYDVESENSRAIKRRITLYDQALKGLERYLIIKAQIEDHLEAGRYDAAQIEAGRARDFEDVPPAIVDLRTLRSRIRTDSDAALAAAVAKALGASATTMPELVTKWQALADVYKGNWVPTSAFKTGGSDARAAAAKAGEIGATVRRFEQAYAADAVIARVAALDFYDLKRDVRAARAVAAKEVAAHLQAWPRRLAAPRLLEENGLAALALAAPEQRIDEAVRAAWARIRDAAETDPSDANRKRVADFENAVARGFFPGLLADAERLRLRLVEEYELRQRQSMALFDSTRARVLAALRRGLPDELERRVDEALKQSERLSPKLRERLRGLRAAGELLRAAQKGALDWLAADGSDKVLQDVRVQGAGGATVVYAQFRVASVDKTAETVSARISRKGSSRKIEISLRIHEFAPDQVLDWASRSEHELAPGTRALLELAALKPVGDDFGRDLRRDLLAYRTVAERFAITPLDAWTAFTRDLVAALRALQAKREDAAGRARAGADGWFERQFPKHKVALDLYLDLADPEGRLRYTDRFDDEREHIEKRMKRCRDILAQQEMLRLFYGGVQVVETAGGRHIVTFDFDDLGQLKNFVRGFARARATRKTVTPDDDTRSRELLLLPGVKGVLRDRPLSLVTLFDPHDLIVLEVRVNTLAGSSILAFDIDGVQFAICSADPSWWKRRFAEDIPLLEDEETRPAFDYHGMGRGTAFHEGRDFGRSFPSGWDWDSRSAGRNFERWKDPKYLAENDEELLALEPGRSYTLRIERMRGQISVYVDDVLRLRRAQATWAERGSCQESNKRIRSGSGHIQILTWTPLVIDDLRLEGKISKKWKERRRREMEDDR